MKRALFLIRCASLLVPARLRGEWSREWLAELYFLRARSAGDVQLVEFARGAFQDAVWHTQSVWDREAFAHQAQSAGFCLVSLLVAIVLIGMVSGFFAMTRTVLLPLPYRDSARIATVSQRGAALTTRSAVRATSVRLWQKESRLLEGVASYSWKTESVKDAAGRAKPVLSARVSKNFFSLLGVHAKLDDCDGCVVLSYDFWQRELGGKPITPEMRLVLNGSSGGRYRVAGVLEKGFWFLSRRIAVWQLVSPAGVEGARTGAVVRLRPDVTGAEVERELSAILQRNGAINTWDTLMEVSPLPNRVRSVFGSFGLALGLAIVVAMASSRLRLPRWNPRAALFFAAKTLLLLAVVLLAGLEFTRAASITMLGGTDLAAEPLSVWLFLLGCTGVLAWSVRDQRSRCRVCLRRLGLPTRVGCPGCLLLDWAGTELVCVEGHGMLHVPEMVSCWHEPEHWTSLDDSWQGLFERS
jgi:hypothetical protein